MHNRALRILFLSGYFPPLAPMGAVRSGKLADYWTKTGHDVRIIAVAFGSGDDERQRQSATYVRYLPYRRPGQIVTGIKAMIMRSPLGHWMFARPKRAEKIGGKEHGTQTAEEAATNAHGLLQFYRQLMQFPDRCCTWIGPAVDLALSWRGEWMPDLIYSSGPPQSGHVAAARLSASLGVPWIAELRDLWVGDPYIDRHPIIHALHERMARKTLAKAAAYVVVTKSAADYMKANARAPVVISYNGFDPQDFAGLETAEPIVHAGVIYPGRRDPTPLFKAIAALGDEGKRIRCLFYHDANGSVAILADRYGIRQSVEIRDAIPRAEILRVERQADILLECRWQDPAGDGVIPGKLFEYIGARRPILSIGSLTGEAAEIVRVNKFGLASNDPGEIRTMLLKALETKSRSGRLPDLASAELGRFARDIQFQKIDDLIEAVLPPKRARAA